MDNMFVTELKGKAKAKKKKKKAKKKPELTVAPAEYIPHPVILRYIDAKMHDVEKISDYEPGLDFVYTAHMNIDNLRRISPPLRFIISILTQVDAICDVQHEKLVIKDLEYAYKMFHGYRSQPDTNVDMEYFRRELIRCGIWIKYSRVNYIHDKTAESIEATDIIYRYNELELRLRRSIGLSLTLDKFKCANGYIIPPYTEPRLTWASDMIGQRLEDIEETTIFKTRAMELVGSVPESPKVEYPDDSTETIVLSEHKLTKRRTRNKNKKKKNKDKALVSYPHKQVTSTSRYGSRSVVPSSSESSSQVFDPSKGYDKQAVGLAIHNLLEGQMAQTALGTYRRKILEIE